MRMKDETFVGELLAILRSRDVLERDVRVLDIEITRGEHGLELEVAFDAQGVRGTVRVPFDRYWRGLSGYETPAAYAPEVAWQVDRAAHRLWSPKRTVRRLPGGQVQWRMLLDALAGEGEVRELGPGRVEVTPPGGDPVTVVVSPDEWAGVLAGTDDVDLLVAELLGPRDDDERFVVCYRGELVASTREELPPVRGRAYERTLAELCAAHPDGLTWSGPGGELG
jgi:hypothetical protein